MCGNDVARCVGTATNVQCPSTGPIAGTLRGGLYVAGRGLSLARQLTPDTRAVETKSLGVQEGTATDSQCLASHRPHSEVPLIDLPRWLLVILYSGERASPGRVLSTLLLRQEGFPVYLLI